MRSGPGTWGGTMSSWPTFRTPLARCRGCCRLSARVWRRRISFCWSLRECAGSTTQAQLYLNRWFWIRPLRLFWGRSTRLNCGPRFWQEETQCGTSRPSWSWRWLWRPASNSKICVNSCCRYYYKFIF